MVISVHSSITMYFILALYSGISSTLVPDSQFLSFKIVSPGGTSGQRPFFFKNLPSLAITICLNPDITFTFNHCSYLIRNFESLKPCKFSYQGALLQTIFLMG